MVRLVEESPDRTMTTPPLFRRRLLVDGIVQGDTPDSDVATEHEIGQLSSEGVGAAAGEAAHHRAVHQAADLHGVVCFCLCAAKFVCALI